MISNYRFQNSNQQALSGICGGQISDFKRAALGGNVKWQVSDFKPTGSLSTGVPPLMTDN